MCSVEIFIYSYKGQNFSNNIRTEMSLATVVRKYLRIYHIFFYVQLINLFGIGLVTLIVLNQI